MPSPADAAFWLLAQQRADQATPQMALAILKAFAQLRASITDAELQALLQAHAVDAIVAKLTDDPTLQSAFAPVQERIRRALGQSIAQTARNFPRPPGGPPRPPITPASTVTVGFDVLNPRVLDGIRTLETKVMTSLTDDVKATVRQVVTRGLSDGLGPKVIAKELRASIGLSPYQEGIVNNFREALRGENGRNPMDYLLRDKRYDGTLAKLQSGELEKLSPEQVDVMVNRYRTRMIAHTSETVARTAMLDAQKQGQYLAVSDAVDKGIYDGAKLTKTWRGVMDSRERETHIAMEGDTVPWDQPYRNGQMQPGDDEYNCRCLSVYRQSKG